MWRTNSGECRMDRKERRVNPLVSSDSIRRMH